MDKWLLSVLFFFIGGFPQEKEPVTSQINSVHPFYISVFEIHHNAGEKTLELTCKIFSDDFENVLKNKFKSPVDFSSAKDQDQIEKKIEGYIQQNLSLRIDGKPVQLKLLGFEKEKESVYSYFEVAAISTLKKLEVKNTVLYDLTSDQANIMHVVVNGKRQSGKLNFPSTDIAFNF